jgi:hypothetical protein
VHVSLLTGGPQLASGAVILVRLLALGLLIAAIIDKNRAAVSRRGARGRRAQRV